MESKVLLIGVGNTHRSDDGLGPVVVDLLRMRLKESELSQQVECCQHAGEASSLLELWRGSNKVIVVDAMQSGQSPGSIHRFEVNQQALPAEFSSYSSHAFSLAQAIELSRVLGVLPEELIVFGMEAQNFNHGTGLSPEVQAAIEQLGERVFQEIVFQGKEQQNA